VSFAGEGDAEGYRPRDVVGGSVDEWVDLYATPEVAGRERTEPGWGWVIARTNLQPYRIGLASGGIKAFYPPQAIIREKVRIQEFPGMASLFRGAERVRDYVAYATEVAVPLSYVVANRECLFPQVFGSNSIPYYPLHLIAQPDKFEGWVAALRGSLIRAIALLRDAGDATAVGKAIALWGETRWATDVEDAFHYGWRALDVMAKGDFASARTSNLAGDSAPLSRYLAELAEPLSEGKSVRIGEFVKILDTINRRAPGPSRERVRRWNELRGVIAHDFPTGSQSKEILDALPEVLSVARQVVESSSW
jgi:hypothetical protein